MARPALAHASALGLAVTMAFGAGVASAGDRALIDFIGYSPDGRYFAFEEYGVQDGSGFAYSDVYIVDLPADKWVYASPYHVEASDAEPDRPLREVRMAALAKAQEKLEPIEIGVPAEILVLLGDGVPANEGKVLSYSIPNGGGPGSTEEALFTLGLSTFAADSPADCVGYIGDKAKGFALSLAEDGAPPVELHRDGKLPKSRGCPLDYRLYAVVRPFEGGAGPAIAIISSYPFGFEGPDRRFIALALGH